MEEKDDELQINFGAARCFIWGLALVDIIWDWLASYGTAGQICANFATCSWEPLTMLNSHFVAGEHGLFGAHESEDIQTILYNICSTIVIVHS